MVQIVTCKGRKRFDLIKESSKFNLSLDLASRSGYSLNSSSKFISDILGKMLRAVIIRSFWKNLCHSWNQTFCSITDDCKMLEIFAFFLGSIEVV